MAFGHVCAVLGCLVAVGSVVASTGKAYYCRDPDTGKLHAVNSTWEAKSFCGNYTCKIRKRNLTNSGYASIRQINITNIPENKNNESKNTTVEVESSQTYGNKDVANDRTQLSIIPVDSKIPANISKDYIEKSSKINPANVENETHETGNIYKTGNVKQALTQYYQNKVTDVKTNKTQHTLDSKDDRYLTESEIAAISDILHTVKRSELDAIVDIYNLAQEIYNEIDVITTPASYVVDDATTNSNTVTESSKQGMKSYWYEPYYKGMHVDDHGTSKDVTAISTAHPKKSFYSFFTGPASSDEDFRRLPYHYHSPPNTQESASYFIEQPTTIKTEFPKPCKKKHINNFQVQNTMPPSSYLLPYPFAYIHQYHLPTDYPKGLLYDIPYTWDYYNRVKKIPPYTGYIGDIAGSNVNTQLQEMPVKQGQISLEPVEPVPKPALEQKTMEHIKAVVQEQDLLRRLIMKTLNKDHWQRQQLMKRYVINDIGKLNNNNTRLRNPYPISKQITLEKVGKVLKLDDFSRKKRSLELNRTPDPIQEEEGLYETFIESTTCQDQTEPGFFRVGNLTQAYPGCCPQLIRNRYT